MTKKRGESVQWFWVHGLFARGVIKGRYLITNVLHDDFQIFTTNVSQVCNIALCIVSSVIVFQ